ncbi:MAG: DUF2807 domain-containing protein [Hyphomonadaceae bacterium]
MERFIFVAAVTIALVTGAFYFLGGPSWSVHIDDMEVGGRQDPVVEVAAGRMDPQSFTAGSISVRYAAANVVVTPEERTDIAIEIDNPGRLPMPEVRLDGGELVVDGRLRRRIGACEGGSVNVRGYGDITASDMPQVRIRAPRRLVLDIGGASNAEVAASDNLDLELTGCGTAQVADVAEELSVELAGSGRVAAGAAQRLNADLAGSGAIETGAIADEAEVDVAGSGSVTLAALNGSLSMDGAGSGNLAVQGGAVTTAGIDLAGSGDVTIAAPVQTLTVSIVGSGDVDVEGAVGDINAEIAGSGGVRAASVSGAVRKEVWGSGDVQVGQ